jgi:hypothetical protein
MQCKIKLRIKRNSRKLTLNFKKLKEYVGGRQTLIKN